MKEQKVLILLIFHGGILYFRANLFSFKFNKPTCLRFQYGIDVNISSTKLKPKQMTKKGLLIVIGLLCIAVSITFYQMRKDPHLSELGNFFWAPLPFAALALFFGLRSR